MLSINCTALCELLKKNYSTVIQICIASLSNLNVSLNFFCLVLPSPFDIEKVLNKAIWLNIVLLEEIQH